MWIYWNKNRKCLIEVGHEEQAMLDMIAFDVLNLWRHSPVNVYKNLCF